EGGQGRPGSVSGAQATPAEPPIGPGGTQPVVIGHAERKPRAEPSDDLRSGNLPAHPAGSYLPPEVRASLARSSAPASGSAARGGAAAGPTPQAPVELGPTGLPRVFEDASSTSQASGEGDVRTQLYRPVDEAARQPLVPAKSPVPLMLVL